MFLIAFKVNVIYSFHQSKAQINLNARVPRTVSKIFQYFSHCNTVNNINKSEAMSKVQTNKEQRVLLWRHFMFEQFSRLLPWWSIISVQVFKMCGVKSGMCSMSQPCICYTTHAEQSWKLFLHLLEHLTILCYSGDKIKSLWAAVIVDVHSLFLNLKIKLQLSTLLANTVKVLNLASLYKYWLINPRSFTFSSHNLKYGAN